MATTSNTPTVDVKAAVRIAAAYFDQLIQRHYSDLAVEEVEKTDDDRFWLVTIGYNVVSTDRSPLAAFQDKLTSREYKIIKVDSQSGEALSMKVRKSF
ncbi:MAG: hypothetical protein ABSD64_12850 [Terriglobales bacterium]